MSHDIAAEPLPTTQTLPTVPRHAAAGAHVPTPDETDRPSRWAFGLGLVGLVVPLVSVLAILLGSLGMGRAARRGTRGRGLAKAGVTLGVIELAFTMVAGAGVWYVWHTYGDDLREGLQDVAQVSREYTDLSVNVDRFAAGDLGAGWDVVRDLGPSGIVELASEAGTLRDLATACRGDEPEACSQLLDALPDGLRTVG